MSFKISIKKSAQKELAKLPVEEYERIRDDIRALGENPRPPGSKKLKGREGWRIRAGDYRVIFEIDETGKTITVLHVGARKDIYK